VILLVRAVTAAALLAWIYLLLFRGRFWRVRDESMPRVQKGARRIAAILPARNEAPLIAKAVTSLLAQDVRGELAVYVVDDESNDGTGERAVEAAERFGVRNRLTVVRSSDLPPGWTGKLWALSQGVQAASEFRPDYILLTDADIEHAVTNVSSLLARCEDDGRDLASYMVRLHCRSVPEKALIPAFVFFFLKLYPPRWIADSNQRIAGAAGGCILIRPAALDRIGGFAAIRGEIIDDCALAGQVKAGGGRIWMGLTSATRSIREYHGFTEIWNTIARTAFSQLRYSPILLLGTIMGMTVLYAVPVAAVLTGDPTAVTIGAATWVGMTVAYAPVVRFYRLSFLWSITLPPSAIFYTGATISSAVRYWAGRGGQWKGRIQKVKKEPE
jgi:hopene-associated glycosyltransferase HpnB